MPPTETVRIRRLPAHEQVAAARTAPQLLAAIRANRGLDPTAEAATPGLGELLPFALLRGLPEALDLLVGCLRTGGHILVVGDYDADGATASALAVRGLRALGAARVSTLVPSRFNGGYGLSAAVVEAAAAQAPSLILTVDNGIASVAGVAQAKTLGIPVLITDHHLPGEQLPQAAAIVNPNQAGCDFPSKHLAGVGVMFYLLLALRARLRATGWFTDGRTAPNLADYLDLVALGTVADVVTLDTNNRILVEQGLRRIRAGRCCPGIAALLEVAGRETARALTSDLAFFVAPRLNAAGRLEDMALGVECLLCDDSHQARTMAAELDTLNRRRREIENEMREQAEQALATLGLDAANAPPGLCLYQPDWHQGVTGILAARLRERYHRPVIAFADSGEADGLRGSARSLDGLHIRDLLDAIDRRHPGLIERFGGHAMAAGLSLPRAHFEDFRTAFATAVSERLGTCPAVPELCSDGELAPALLTLETAELIQRAEPWGKGFTEPRFDGWFRVAQARLVGEQHLKLRLLATDGAPVEAIGFRLGERLSSAHGKVRLAYRLDVNRFRGTNTVQLLIDELLPAA